MRHTVLSASLVLAALAIGCGGGEGAGPASSGSGSAKAKTETKSVAPTATASEAPKPAPAPATGGVDQSKPENVLTALIDAAKNDDDSKLSSLCAEGKGDGDVKKICAVKKGDKKWAEFVEAFKTGAIKGTPKIEGDKASIDFTFGPDGKKSETMNLWKSGDKWYLAGF
ncbi:MAG: hypothetical protein HY908_18910 [Myxococcales bacterium]|nr:hypothetical protein [Myxococcales bacterium]